MLGKKYNKVSALKSRLGGIVSILVLSATTSAYAAPTVPGSGCGLTVAPAAITDKGFNFPNGAGAISILPVNAPASMSGGALVIGGVNVRYCFFSSAPSSVDTTCNTAITENAGTNFIATITLTGVPQPESCLYSYELNTANPDMRTNGAITPLAPVIAPTAVPIFTPLGLLAMMSGLLWFGKRRRKFK